MIFEPYVELTHFTVTLSYCAVHERINESFAFQKCTEVQEGTGREQRQQGLSSSSSSNIACKDITSRLLPSNIAQGTHESHLDLCKENALV